MRELNIGIIGLGFMGKTHSYGYKTIPFYYSGLPFRINLIAACSRRLENASEAKNTLGFEYATDNMYDIINDKKIDIVNICTPNSLHKEAVIAALRAGKHIYCDKPLAASLCEAEEIVSEFKRSDSIAQMALQYRFFPATLRAKQIIDEGRLGKILSFRACYLHSGSVDPNRPISWKHDKSQGGGVLYDMGIHIVDMIYHLIGEFDSLFCKTQTIYPKRPDAEGNMVDIFTDDAVYLTFSMKNGAMGTVEASKIATGSNDELRFEIHGDKGALRFNLMEPSFLEFYDNTKPDSVLGGDKGYTRIECVQRYPDSNFPGPKYTVGWIRAHVHCLYNFLSCVVQGNQPSPSFEEAAYLQYILDKGYESAHSNSIIKL